MKTKRNSQRNRYKLLIDMMSDFEGHLLKHMQYLRFFIEDRCSSSTMTLTATIE